jgi:hypothetical protein
MRLHSDRPRRDVPARLMNLRMRQLGARVCAYCGHQVPRGELLHREHVVPLSRGGTAALSNEAYVCASCNLSKRNMLLLEWACVHGGLWTRHGSNTPRYRLANVESCAAGQAPKRQGRE